jgi:hypothetical protein
MSRVDLANDLLASLHDAAEIFVNGATDMGHCSIPLLLISAVTGH